MRFVHDRAYLNAGDAVVVQCSHQCNVRVMEDTDFQNYKRFRSHNYVGGHYRMLPVKITVPHSGYWNTAVDLGGGHAAFRCKIGYLKSEAA